LEIETDNFEDLLISRLESHKLLISVLSRLTLNDEMDIILSALDRIGEELRVFVAVLNILRHIEACFNLSHLVANGIDHLSTLKHKSLME
jgi:hypothetical protein